MAHHSQNELSEELRELFNKHIVQPRDDLFPPLGATGRFPQGKLNETDEGEIAFGVAADKRKKKVIIDFGKQVVWVGMDAKQARELADSLNRKADEIDAERF